MNLTESNSTTSSNEGLLKGIMYVSMAFVVVFINFLVIVSCYLRHKKRRGILDVFVVNLAISSILTSITVIGIVAYVRATNNEYFIGKMGECYVQYFFGTMLRLTDIAITTSIAVDRFIALYKPIFYRTNVKQKQGYIVCGVIWLSSALIACLPIVGVGNISQAMESLCTADWTTEIAIIVITVAYIQFIIVLVCYIGIFKSINGFIKRQKAMSMSQQNSSQSISSTRDKTDNDSVSSATSNDSFASRTSSVSFADQVFQTDIADKLVQLSRDNIKAAFREVKDAKNIELETNLEMKTVKTRTVHGDIPPITKSSSSVNLRIKAAINRVSWSDESNINNTESTNNSKQVIVNQVKPEFVRSKTCPVKVFKNVSNANDDVFVDDKNLRKEKRSRSEIKNNSNGEKSKEESGIIRKSFSVMVRDKWKAKKLRRSVSINRFWKESQHFAKVMGVVVLIFYISWLPLAIAINIVLINGVNNKKAHDSLWICYNLSLLSSVAIPIAYAVMCKPYREGYKRLWNCMKRMCCWKIELKVTRKH